MNNAIVRIMVGAWAWIGLTVAGQARETRSVPEGDRAPARVSCRIETDRSTLPADTVGTAILKITLNAQAASPDTQRTPVNLAIVLDRSSSMQGEKIEHARQAAIEAVRRLRPDDIVSLVAYGSQIETVIPAQSARNTEWMEEQIRRIQPRGATALFGGVSQGAAELRKSVDGRHTHRMILLSDGIANVGPNQPSDLGRLGASLLKEGIQVSTVGIGLDYNDALMAELARQSGGNTHFVENSADLPRILAAELGEAQQLVARRTTLEIELPAGVELVRIIGRDGSVSARKATIPLHHLSGGQSRYALVEVRVPAHAPDAVRELARARVSYEDPATGGQVVSGEETVSVTFSANPATVTASLNAAVQIEALNNSLALAREDAIRLSDEGRTKDAAAQLKTVAEAYRDMGAQLGNEALREEADKIENNAAELEKTGLDRRQRNKFRAESYQTINQQKVR